LFFVVVAVVVFGLVMWNVASMIHQEAVTRPNITSVQTQHVTLPKPQLVVKLINGTCVAFFLSCDALGPRLDIAKYAEKWCMMHNCTDVDIYAQRGSVIGCIVIKIRYMCNNNTITRQ